MKNPFRNKGRTQAYDLTKTYTTEEVAAIFKCTPAHVQKMARDRELPVIPVARKLLFPKEAIHQHLQDRLIKAK